MQSFFDLEFKFKCIPFTHLKSGTGMEFKNIYQALCQNHSHTSSLATIYLLTKQNNTQRETNKPDKHRTSASALV